MSLKNPRLIVGDVDTAVNTQLLPAFNALTQEMKARGIRQVKIDLDKNSFTIKMKKL